MSKLSTQGGLWGLGCDSGHVVSCLAYFLSQYQEKRQTGTSVSPLARLEPAGSRDPCSYPCMPLPTQVWIILQGDVLVFVHMLLA